MDSLGNILLLIIVIHSGFAMNDCLLMMTMDHPVSIVCLNWSGQMDKRSTISLCDLKFIEDAEDCEYFNTTIPNKSDCERGSI